MSGNKNDNSEVRLIQLNNYVRPTLHENESDNWVLNGKNNQFYQYVIDRFNGSPTNAAIINSYVDLIYGRGLFSENEEALNKLNEIFNARDLKAVISDFELFGEASIQIVKKRSKLELPNLYHIAKDKVVPSIENEDAEIEGYWYSRNWLKRYKYKPVYYPSFGTSNEAIEIYNIKPYKAGKTYFADPDYLAGLPYAEIEEEIANYCVNHIKNGLSFGYIVNIPNGVNWTPEKKDEFEKMVKQRLTGSNNAGKFILSFNGRDMEVTITPIEVNSAHKQWEFLTNEARQQLITAHKVTSPMLFGIKDSTGLGNNADELDTAEKQLYKRVIKPKQQFITDALEEILLNYGIECELEFLPLTDYEEESNDNEVVEVEEETVNDSEKTELEKQKKKCNSHLLTDLGEDIDSTKWDLIYEEEVDYNNEDSLKLASTGRAMPNAKSIQDNENVMIRYRYVDINGKSGAKGATGEREFCQKMIRSNKLYRKEDILRMGDVPVNAGWGLNGADTYSIWLYKGGGNCHHKWNRVIYLKKGVKVDVNNPLAEIISNSEARRKGYKVITNENEVSIAPINMPNQGFVNK